MEMVKLLLDNESGQSMVEYGLLLALLSIAVIAVLVVLGPRIAGFFTTVDTELQNATPAP
jgi:pilus assembly protein Flp/PilA